MLVNVLSDVVSHKGFCDEDKMLIEALTDVDRALAKMPNSDMEEGAVDNCAPFISAVERLKNSVFDSHQLTYQTILPEFEQQTYPTVGRPS